jgi:winged helix-turn-helix
MALLWVLNFSDGRHSLLDIAERAALPFSTIRGAADVLRDADLLRPRDESEADRSTSDVGSSTMLKSSRSSGPRSTAGSR